MVAFDATPAVSVAGLTETASCAGTPSSESPMTFVAFSRIVNSWTALGAKVANTNPVSPVCE